MIDAYRTLVRPSVGRIRRKRSRFFAYLDPVDSPTCIEQRLSEIRKTHHDASHHCSAFRLIAPSAPIRSCDDAGEPSGSAGRPILERLEEAELLNVLATVVRYFGGTKLGVGGLMRAYGDAAAAAIDAAEIVVHRVTVELLLRFPADVNSGVMATIHRWGAVVEGIQYGEAAEIRAALPPSRLEGFIASVRDATGGRALVEVLG